MIYLDTRIIGLKSIRLIDANSGSTKDHVVYDKFRSQKGKIAVIVVKPKRSSFQFSI